MVHFLVKNAKSQNECNTKQKSSFTLVVFKGCGMSTLFVLVFPCFRENVVVTCKIGSFCVVYIIYFRKTKLFSFLEIKFQNGAHLKKRAIFDLRFTFFSDQGKLQKFLQHTSHSHTYMYFAHPIDFFALPILKKYKFIRYGFSLV